jgi:hypothetical protein
MLSSRTIAFVAHPPLLSLSAADKPRFDAISSSARLCSSARVQDELLEEASAKLAELQGRFAACAQQFAEAAELPPTEPAAEAEQ